MGAEKIEVSLGIEGGPKVFDSLNEVESWLANEKEFWKDFTNPPWKGPAHQNVSGYFNNFFNAIRQHLENAKSLINQAAERKTEPALEGVLNNIKAAFIDFFENKRGIYSGTPRAKFLSQLKDERGMSIAAYCCGQFLRADINFNAPDGVYGAVAAVLFDSGLKESFPHEALALQELRQNWETTFQRFKESLQVESDKHQKLNSDLDKLLIDQKKEFGGVISNAKEEWQKLQITYDRTLALHAPVTYWQRKVKSHRNLSWAFGAVSIVIAAIVLGLLIPEAKELISVPANVKDPEKWHPEYWRLAMLIASGLLGVWVIRIFVRLFLSNVHLYTDAKERVTMVRTYLALLRRGNLPKDDDKLFILQTLFRPTATGLVKDDAVPLTVLESLGKLKGHD